MASEDYLRAQKFARNAYRSAVAAGDYPYLPALDEITDNRMVQTEEPLGIISIPLDQIVGTKTAGRQQSFAYNFMPLMPENSEFAQKWDSVVRYHLTQGVGDPIQAYEYMNRYYVLEGNKRVSVLKYFGADSIEGSVTRLVPYPEDTIENRIYYEYMDFYKGSQINYLTFSNIGSFPKLTEAVGKKPAEQWTDDEKINFKSLYTQFSEIFESKGGSELGITPADALLFYLSLYPYSEVITRTGAEMRADVDKLWDNLPILSEQEKANVSVVFRPSDETGEKLFAKFLRIHKAKQLKVAFIHDKPADVSGWTYMHELGRMALDQEFGERIRTEAHFLKDADTDISELLEETIAAGNHIIFTPNSRFLAASLKASIEHPEVKILNCSIGQPYRTLRTYYGRLYEAKFLCGMVAGAMTPNDKIAYMATLPNFGSVSNINAFALGARMTNPRARIYLHWSSQTNAEPFRDMLEREQITLVSDNDMITPASKDRVFGLYTTSGGGMKRLATPMWNWGRFYVRIIRDLLQGSWDSAKEAKEKPAINYWWGISGGIIDLIMSDELPKGIRTLTEIVRGQMYVDYFNPFWGQFRKQDGSMAGRENEALTPDEMIMMDYLAEGVVGSIPPLCDLTDEARERIELQSNITPAATTIG